jgi:hypothetical protein
MLLTCHHFASVVVGIHERSFDGPLELLFMFLLASEIQDDDQRNT